MRPTVAAKRARFAELHRSGCFVMPNPWDVGSAKYLASLGFKALATTSAGMAFAAGEPDNGVTRAYALRHIAELVEATELPFNADFEGGFGATPDEVHESAKRCVATGVAGFSIEDFTGDARAPLYPLDESVRRLRAARSAIDASAERVLLVARTEVLWADPSAGMKEATRRLVAFAEAGADVLFAPGLKVATDVAEIVRVAGPLPVSVVVGSPGFNVRQLADLGVRRISTGAALARAAWGGFMRAARDIAENGRFDDLGGIPASGALDEIFAH